MIVAAIVLGIFSIVQIVRTFTGSADGPRVAVPGATTLHLDDGRWVIYENVSVRRADDPTDNGPISIGVNDVEVTDPDGNELAIDDVTGAQTITRNGAFFVGAVEFHAPRSDDYTITVRGESAQAFVARALTDRIGRAALWVLLGVGGLVLLVVGIVFTALPPRRESAQPVGIAPYPSWAYPTGAHPPGPSPPAPYPPAGPRPGWYADPQGGSDARWWDGARWTDHVRPL